MSGFIQGEDRFQATLFPERLVQGMQFEINGRTWQVLTAGGHTPEHVCLYSHELGVLISGDQVLAQISSNVSVWPDSPDAEPLSLYLKSLSDLSELPSETLVLPAHGRPFYGLQHRLTELEEHHADRLDLLREGCRQTCTVADLLSVLFERSLDDQQLPFAVGEALAHLNSLIVRGEVRRDLNVQQQWIFQYIG